MAADVNTIQKVLPSFYHRWKHFLFTLLPQTGIVPSHLYPHFIAYSGTFLLPSFKKGAEKGQK